MNPIDLTPFCANGEDPRDYLNTPFSIDEYTYASNGRIAVRVPRFGDFQAPPDNLIDNIRKLFSVNAGEMFPVPGHTVRRGRSCSPCRGRGTVRKCPECDGEGEVTAETDFNEYEVTCKTCGGDGQIPYGDDVCGCCGGSGRISTTDRDVVHIGQANISVRYANLISLLPGAIIEHRETYDANQPVHFRCAGAEGVVMQLRR